MAINTNALNLHQYLKGNCLLINHLICTTPDTEQIENLMFYIFIIQKLKTIISAQKFPYGTAYH